MNELRNRLAQDLLGADYDSLTAQKRSVIDLIADQKPSGVDPLMAEERSYWERMADQVASVGGSWSFIFGFAATLVVWVSTNLILTLSGHAFDPYPFIFLNLILSMIAAVQAPIIMMSQNRQAAKDRAAAEHDYVVNLRAELEIMLLHDKLDALRESDILARADAIDTRLEQLCADVAEMKARLGR